MLHPHSDLSSLTTLCSNHAPLLLRTDSTATVKKRFHFHAFWPKFPGYLETVERAWHCPLQGADPFCRLDWLLRNTARSLQSWSQRFVGNVWIQLEITKEVIQRLEMAMGRRTLAGHKEQLRKKLKLKALSLSLLQRNIARQESRLLWLSDGDVPSKFFHTHANGRRRKKHIHALEHEGRLVTDEMAKAELAFSYFDDILGMPPNRTIAVKLAALGINTHNLTGFEDCFTEAEVWGVIKSLPTDKAPSPNGFTTRFLQTTWPVIRHDVMSAFDAFWSLDLRSFQSVIDAIMVLLPKSNEACSIKDYRPISLIHSMGKLIAKVLANSLLTHLNCMVHHDQSAFIKGRSIHNSFWFVQASAKALHARRTPRILLKVDIAKAFDSVAWPFLLQIMEHMGFSWVWRDRISALLSSATTQVSMNGSARDKIQYARGLR